MRVPIFLGKCDLFWSTSKCNIYIYIYIYHHHHHHHHHQGEGARVRGPGAAFHNPPPLTPQQQHYGMAATTASRRCSCCLAVSTSSSWQAAGDANRSLAKGTRRKACAAAKGRGRWGGVRRAEEQRSTEEGKGTGFTLRFRTHARACAVPACCPPYHLASRPRNLPTHPRSLPPSLPCALVRTRTCSCTWRVPLLKALDW